MWCTEERIGVVLRGAVVESVFGVCFCYEVKWGVCKSGKVTSVRNACRITNWTFRVYEYLAYLHSFSICMSSKVWSTVPWVCPVSSVWCACFEFFLFVPMAWIYSLYRTLKVRPLCQTYLSSHSFVSIDTLSLNCLCILFLLDFRWFYYVGSFKCYFYTRILI
jgi:hypothetical protein